jgi:hypothetical protein
MSLKKLLMIFLVLFFAFANFSHARWQKLSGGGEVDYTQYFDTDSVKLTENGKWRIWDLMDYKYPKVATNGEMLRSSKSYWEIDCKEYQIKLLTGSWFTGQMSSGQSMGLVRSGEYQYISPGSIGESLAIPLCTPEKINKPN